MLKLEGLQPGARVAGLSTAGTATEKAIQWLGDQSAEVTGSRRRRQPETTSLWRDRHPCTITSSRLPGRYVSAGASRGNHGQEARVGS